ncbi:hypothetical protein [Spirulina major]|uniref:hypothetical protein n=1 Tax=Spirulina major TaxID=270636 RepID=UPI0009327C5B|nr:hypothetical protein [Spirulina major]
MKLHHYALLAVLGLSSPLIVAATVPPIAIAQTLPTGVFQNENWIVTLDYTNNTLAYYGESKRNGSNIYLSGASVGGTRNRRIYTWHNGDVRYQVAWQPAQTDLIRLQVFDGRGRELVNELLVEEY